MIPRQREIISQETEHIADNLELLKELGGCRALITGAGGFVGLWLLKTIEAYNKKNDEKIKVHAMDRNFSELKKSFPTFWDNQEFVMEETDICSSFNLEGSYQYVIHLAGTPDNRVHSSDPLGVIKTNVWGTENLLAECSRQYELRKVLLLSSGLVYGRQAIDAPNPKENILATATFNTALASYTESKRLMETLAQTYRSQFRIPIAIMRPFAFVGPGQSLDRPWAMNNFFLNALRGNPVKVLGDGKGLRSYMYASDMTQWIFTFLVKSTVGDTLNLGSDSEITLKEAAEAVASITSPNLPIQVTNENGNAPRDRLVADLSYAKKRYGLELNFDSFSAIQKAYKWYALES
jgi:nucleoside-diphosphate-sugar epimerase